MISVIVQINEKIERKCFIYPLSYSSFILAQAVVLFSTLPVTQLHFDTILYVLPQALATLVPVWIAIVMSLKKWHL